MSEATPAHPGAAASPDDRIIEAALSLIAQQGLGGVTMSGIADTAGVARQTLYNHYPDIDSIVAEAISRHNRESIDLLEASQRVVDLPEDKLEQLVRHVVSIGPMPTMLVASISGYLPTPEPLWAPTTRRSIVASARYLRRGNAPESFAPTSRPMSTPS